MTMAMIDMSKWASYRFNRGSRYYVLSLVQNLWGEWEIQKVNGRIRSRQRKERHEPCNSYEDGRLLLKECSDYRVIKRHYCEELESGRRNLYT